MSRVEAIAGRREDIPERASRRGRHWGVCTAALLLLMLTSARAEVRKS